MSVAAAAFALTGEFDFQGSTLTLRPLDYEALARFGTWAKDRARAEIFRVQREGMDAEQMESVFQKDVAAGEYEPGGGVFGRAVSSETGGRKVLELMLVAPPEEQDSAKWRLEKSWDIYAAVEEVPGKDGADPTVEPVQFRRALAKCRELNADPKAVAARRRPTPTRRETPSR